MIKRHNQSPSSIKKQHIFNDMKEKTLTIDQRYKKSYLQKQNWIESDMTFCQDGILNQSQKEKSYNRQFNTKSLCSQCFIYSLKLQELTSSYQQLLLCKNQEIRSCRDIINKLQQKNKEIQLKFKLQIDKNRKFKHYVQNKSFNQQNSKKDVSQAVQYLKRREVTLIQNLMKVQKELYVKEIHFNDQIIKKQTYSSQNNQIQNCQIQSSSVSQKSFQNNKRTDLTNHNPSNTIYQKNKNFQVPQINMHQYIKKCNQLELAHDNNLVLSIQTKIQTVKHLQDTLLKCNTSFI